jgi:hypothetical protein
VDACSNAAPEDDLELGPALLEFMLVSPQLEKKRWLVSRDGGHDGGVGHSFCD